VSAEGAGQPSIPAESRRVRGLLDRHVGLHEQSTRMGHPKPDQVGMHVLTRDQREASCQVPRIAPQSLGNGRQGQRRRLVVPVEMRKGTVGRRAPGTSTARLPA